jgi:hypothetical protein
MQVPIKLEFELKEDSKSLRKFINVLSKALGFVGVPLQKYLEGKAQASTAVTLAKAEIAADDLRQMAKLRRDYLELRRAENIRAVVRKAPALLDSNPSDESVDEDLAVQFFEEAQDISDNDMQGLWSRILVGEVNKPGSFALRTLKCLKMMTKEEAQLFERVVSFSWTNSLGSPFILESEIVRKRWEEGDEKIVRVISGSAINHLKNIGLVAPSDTLYDLSRVNGRPYSYFGRTFVFDVPVNMFVSPSGGKLIEPLFAETYFTQTGLQLRTVAAQTTIPGYADEEMAYQSVQYKIGYHEVTADRAGI